MIKRSEGGGVSHAVRQRVAHSTAPGRRAGQSASSGCGQLSGDSGGCMRRDGTEERVACGPMLGSFNQNITRDADDSARDTRVGRRLLCRLPPGPPTIGGRVGRSATVSRDHTSFVRVVWMEAARRGDQSDDLCGLPLPAHPPVPLHSWHKTKDGSPFSA